MFLHQQGFKLGELLEDEAEEADEQGVVVIVTHDPTPPPTIKIPSPPPVTHRHRFDVSINSITAPTPHPPTHRAIKCHEN